MDHDQRMHTTQDNTMYVIERLAQITLIAAMGIVCGLALTLLASGSYFLATYALTFALN